MSAYSTLAQPKWMSPDDSTLVGELVGWLVEGCRRRLVVYRSPKCAAGQSVCIGVP